MDINVIIKGEPIIYQLNLAIVELVLIFFFTLVSICLSFEHKSEDFRIRKRFLLILYTSFIHLRPLSKNH